jgi:hypothetical protein
MIINITITESPVQLLSGIPLNVSLEANIPSTIFYTIDGSEPTELSNIYISPIKLPTSRSLVVLKIYATNGVDYSPIITKSYSTNVLGNRMPRSTVVGLDSSIPSDPPSTFGSSSPNPTTYYGESGGITVDDYKVEGYPDGYDGTATGTTVGRTDKQYNTENYDIKYSTTDHIGQTGRGIGTLPAKTKIVQPIQLNNSNNANSKLFNPKSLVIIQDGREENENPPIMMRQFFSLGNPETERDGILYNTTAFDGLGTTGTFLKPHYNPKDNTWTFYYRDFDTNRWIMSIEPVKDSQVNTSINQLLLPSSTFAEKKVFKWFPFKRSKLI